MKKSLLAPCLMLVIITLFFSACGGPTPYKTPSPGEWDALDGSFKLLESGEISDFYLSLYGEDNESSVCLFSLGKNLPVVDGVAEYTFISNNLVGKTGYSIKVVFNSASTATLFYEYNWCPGISDSHFIFDAAGNLRSIKGKSTVTLKN